METVLTCPVCGENQFKPYVSCKDYLVSKQDFTIEECTTCKFRLTNPRPDKGSIDRYYQSEEYVSHNDQSRGLVNSVYKVVRNYTLNTKLNLINRLNEKQGRILDVGCGTGTFLETCKAGGWQIDGIEPDSTARSAAEQKLQIAIKSGLEELADKPLFNVITLWHVLEHIPDLNDTIQQLYKLLDPAGTLVIAVPNSNSYDAQYFKEFWAAYDLPRHLHHFTYNPIKALFGKHNFQLVSTKPMVFDAYYIAMLSTRYQTGKTDYLKSLRLGFTSNSKASKSGEWSSLIYIFKKM